jgi:hypothetical protein
VLSAEQGKVSVSLSAADPSAILRPFAMCSLCYRWRITCGKTYILDITLKVSELQSSMWNYFRCDAAGARCELTGRKLMRRDVKIEWSRH